MARIVSVRSFRGGTGKSNISANLATLVASSGRAVGIVDTDISSPGVHVVFGLSEDRIEHTLNDYLWGQCRIDEAAHDVTPDGLPGSVHVIPASLKTGAITKVLREVYDVGTLVDGFRDVIDSLSLDYLFIDTHPGR
ncbi:MAG: MinD/ParA family protein [Anaerolineae bacterium]